MSKKRSTNLTRQLSQRSRGRRQALAAQTRLAETKSRLRNDPVPDMRLESRTTSSLNAPPRNVRQINQAHVAEIAEAIERLGFANPILITEEGQILDGVSRWEAAKVLGIDEIPCLVLRDASPKQIRMLRIALNRLGEKGQWELEELRIEMEELKLEDEPITILGFDTPELDQIMVVDGPPDARLNNVPLPTMHGPAVAREGDVWHLGRHRLACADATRPESYRLLFWDSPGPARAMFTDPPYNIQIGGFAVGRGGAGTPGVCDGLRRDDG